MVSIVTWIRGDFAIVLECAVTKLIDLHRRHSQTQNSHHALLSHAYSGEDRAWTDTAVKATYTEEESPDLIYSMPTGRSRLDELSTRGD